jgi:hypothetical protein
VAISAGCDDLDATRAYDLEPVQSETISSVTTLKIGFDALTDGGHAIAIRASADDGGAVLACSEIPNRASESSG